MPELGLVVLTSTKMPEPERAAVSTNGFKVSGPKNGFTVRASENMDLGSR